MAPGRERPWFLTALLAVAGAGALRALLAKLFQLLRRGQRSLADLPQPRGPRLQHIVFLAFPDLAEDSEDRQQFGAVVEKINSLQGVRASFDAYSSSSLSKDELLATLGRPDVSHRLTHCLYIVAQDLQCLRRYLHGPIQQGELSPLIGKFFRGVMVMDVELGLELAPRVEQDDRLLQIVMLRFQPHVTRDSPLYASLQEIIGEFGKLEGIQASLRHAGYGELDKAEVSKALDWPERSQGFTHCLTILADSVALLKSLLSSEVYGRWLKTEAPHLFNDGLPAAVIFCAPLREALCRA